jgi:hypothetical protein
MNVRLVSIVFAFYRSADNQVEDMFWTWQCTCSIPASFLFLPDRKWTLAIQSQQQFWLSNATSGTFVRFKKRRLLQFQCMFVVMYLWRLFCDAGTRHLWSLLTRRTCSHCTPAFPSWWFVRTRSTHTIESFDWFERWQSTSGLQTSVGMQSTRFFVRFKVEQVVVRTRVNRLDRKSLFDSTNGKAAQNMIAFKWKQLKIFT